MEIAKTTVKLNEMYYQIRTRSGYGQPERVVEDHLTCQQGTKRIRLRYGQIDFVLVRVIIDTTYQYLEESDARDED
ncbi:MAG: hypothetical protein CMB80_02135 [Flammeovirgaceae bacterium]|nr:hypothetical protein [Flammeovirgaceae bacterium]